jgi:ATPase family associated with various cellular activities (AAA)
MTNLHSNQELVASRNLRVARAIAIKDQVDSAFNRMSKSMQNTSSLAFLQPFFTSLMIGEESTTMSVVHLVSTPGLGKTTLIEKVVEELGLNSGRVARFSAEGISGGKNSLDSELKFQLRKNTELNPPVIIIDETQRLATLDKDGKTTGNMNNLTSLLEFLSSGELSSKEYYFITALREVINLLQENNLRIKDFDKDQILDKDEVLHGDETSHGAVDNRIISAFYFVNQFSKNYNSVKNCAAKFYNNLQFLFERADIIMQRSEFLELDNDALESLVGKLEKFVQLKVSYKKALVICLWNIDNLYDDILKDVDLSNTDYVSYLTGNITTDQILASLKTKFEPSQISRFGLNWLPMPTFSYSEYYAFVNNLLSQKSDFVFNAYGLKIEFDETLINFILRNGIQPILGYRSILSTLSLVDSVLKPLVTSCFSKLGADDDFSGTMYARYDLAQFCITLEYGSDIQLTSQLVGNVDKKHQSGVQSQSHTLAINSVILSTQAIVYAIKQGFVPIKMEAEKMSLGTMVKLPNQIKSKSTAETNILMYIASAQALLEVFGQDAPMFAQELIDLGHKDIVELNFNVVNQGRSKKGCRSKDNDFITKMIEAIEAVQVNTEKCTLDGVKFVTQYLQLIIKVAQHINKNHGILLPEDLVSILQKAGIDVQFTRSIETIGVDYLSILAGANDNAPDFSTNTNYSTDLVNQVQKQIKYMSED